MPSLEESIGVFEQMTDVANVASGFNESFLNSISAMESVASESMNMELSITGYSEAAADVQNQLNGVIENVNEAQQVQNDYNESLTNFMNMASGVGSRIKSLASSFGKRFFTVPNVPPQKMILGFMMAISRWMNGLYTSA